MVYRLIRVDSEEPDKLALELGTHIIGRGKFLHNDDNDKRVSRCHAELEVTDDLLTLKSLHQNPCFYIKRNSKDTVILHQNDIITLNTGDKFGLLPDNFWYEILTCSELDSAKITVTINKDNEINNEKDHCPQVISNDTLNNVNADINETESPVKIDMVDEHTDLKKSGSPSLLTTDPTDEDSTQAYNVKNEGHNSEPSTPNKRSHDSLDSIPVDSKKVKTEPASPGPQAGPSNDQVAPTANGVDEKPNVAAPDFPVKPAAPPHLRERCIYGANCYRRNPQHKAQFSHPSDSDWGVGERGVCPYGSACQRHDPRHWQHHDHPPGVLPPQHNARRQGRQRKKQRQRRASESEDNDDGDSPRPDLIVTGKRSRKPINTNTTTGFSESEEEEDPYQTDESDEWEPPSDITNSEDFLQNI